ncbi:Polyprenyl synthetase [Chloroherpeton thalassium ATCC 35110]|uniref:Polyprenyl synthetase n=1 Tax=Chloroherpeton thalassium (strain ATCC 35110 / GB-78) TaxID=517418 RepID=B3QU77_CHLT3|nr:polyprenyl synthetase family protein [Chloroherpeton thalassium]ACF12875.1 Polyprenyl synthetase [Chloroherpeton thalassium ATCC 35110]
MKTTTTENIGMDIQQKYLEFHTRINEELQQCLLGKEPKSLYEPATYILTGKGKRVRPVLVLLGAESICGTSDHALNLALSVEVLHNFTLIHDDIMDNAALRHGRETVHLKWNENAAILSGDMMLAFAYELALKTNSSRLTKILDVITQSTIVICEGQTYDMDFEKRTDVTMSEYLDMISKKTGRLIAASLELGGLAAEATDEQLAILTEYGELIGQAFQVQDDLLDIMADDKKFGKVPGGDLMEGKKTFLLLRALELTTGEDHLLLQSVIDNHGIAQERIPEIKDIYERCGILNEAQELINSNFEKAVTLSEKLPNEAGREALVGFTAMVMKRDS